MVLEPLPLVLVVQREVCNDPLVNHHLLKDRVAGLRSKLPQCQVDLAHSSQLVHPCPGAFPMRLCVCVCVCVCGTALW